MSLTVGQHQTTIIHSSAVKFSVGGEFRMVSLFCEACGSDSISTYTHYSGDGLICDTCNGYEMFG